MSNLRASTIVKTISDLSTPLHLAAQNGHTEVAKVILDENGAVINNLDVMKWTPLHWAAKGGHLETAKLLLEYNADINLKDDYNRTPLKVAKQCNKMDVANFIKNWRKPNSEVDC